MFDLSLIQSAILGLTAAILSLQLVHEYNQPASMLTLVSVQEPRHRSTDLPPPPAREAMGEAPWDQAVAAADFDLVADEGWRLSST